jgi:hypothetical protein
VRSNVAPATQIVTAANDPRAQVGRGCFVPVGQSLRSTLVAWTTLWGGEASDRPTMRKAAVLKRVDEAAEHSELPPADRATEADGPFSATRGFAEDAGG